MNISLQPFLQLIFLLGIYLREIIQTDLTLNLLFHSLWQQQQFFASSQAYFFVSNHLWKQSAIGGVKCVHSYEHYEAAGQDVSYPVPSSVFRLHTISVWHIAFKATWLLGCRYEIFRQRLLCPAKLGVLWCPAHLNTIVKPRYKKNDIANYRI